MRLKLNTFIIFLFIATSLYSQNAKFIPIPSDRVKQNIDFDWRFINSNFSFEEETHQVNQFPWEVVNLPHDWTICGEYKEEHNPTQGFLPMEIGWYNKGIRLPDSWEDKKVFIVFDGIYRSIDVWMNYIFLGHHESGYASLSYDFTGIGTAISDRINWNLMKAMKNAGFNFYRSSHNPTTPSIT